MELGPARVPEAGAHPEKVLSGVGPFGGCTQAEESVVFDGALPQVFARLLVPKSEYESVFLLEAAVLVVLNHHQGQLLLLEVQLGDLGPEEEP